MNRAIPDEIVEEIRSRVNIVDLLGSYVHLKRGGNGVYKALCPFHQEKTPSFTVNENRQNYPYQAPLSLGFSRQEHWSGLPFPSPRHESEK